MMTYNMKTVATLVATVVVMACQRKQDSELSSASFTFHLPPGVDEPDIPMDNPLTEKKIALGEQLFFDKALSIDSSVSCSSCHLPGLAFTDGTSLSTGVYGRLTSRNSPSLLYAAWQLYLFHDGGNPSLESQVIGPVENESEMNLNFASLIQRLRESESYQTAFLKVYGESPNAQNITGAIASFERSLAPFTSKYDDYLRGGDLSAAEKRGLALFESDDLNCSKCHVPPMFTDYSFRNNGMVPFDGLDSGRARITLLESDKLKFKVPSLRNVEVTGPYFHNGSIVDLEQLITLYATGGFNTENQDSTIAGFALNEDQKLDLLAFLKTLTDR